MTPTLMAHQDDCWPACLATIFDVPLSEVEHLTAKDPGFREETQKWLAKRGLFFIEIVAEATPKGMILPFSGGGASGADGGLCILAHGNDIQKRHAVVVEIYCPSSNQVGFRPVHDPNPGGLVPLSRTTHIFLFCKIITR